MLTITKEAGGYKIRAGRPGEGTLDVFAHDVAEIHKAIDHEFDFMVVCHKWEDEKGCPFCRATARLLSLLGEAIQ